MDAPIVQYTCAMSKPSRAMIRAASRRKVTFASQRFGEVQFMVRCIGRRRTLTPSSVESNASPWR
jgi:hypothetical protein